jgi:hypothetical protein
MDQAVYSASPLWVFMGTFLGVGFVIVLGVFALIYAFFNRKQKKIVRVFMGILGLFLCAVGALGLGFTALSMLTGTKTATVLLAQKTAAQDNCGDNGSTCTRYVLEATTGQHSYDFTVEQKAFDATQEGGCYRVTYYPNTGLFAANESSDLYLAVAHVTRIEQMQPGDCQ